MVEGVGVRAVSRLCDKAPKGWGIKRLGELFSPNAFVRAPFRVVKTSLSAMARLVRLPFRPMLSGFFVVVVVYLRFKLELFTFREYLHVTPFC